MENMHEALVKMWTLYALGIFLVVLVICFIIYFTLVNTGRSWGTLVVNGFFMSCMAAYGNVIVIFIGGDIPEFITHTEIMEALKSLAENQLLLRNGTIELEVPIQLIEDVFDPEMTSYWEQNLHMFRFVNGIYQSVVMTLGGAFIVAGILQKLNQQENGTTRSGFVQAHDTTSAIKSLENKIDSLERRNGQRERTLRYMFFISILILVLIAILIFYTVLFTS